MYRDEGMICLVSEDLIPEYTLSVNKCAMSKGQTKPRRANEQDDDDYCNDCLGLIP